MAYFIRIIDHDGSIQKVELQQGETLVGRSRSATVKVKEPDVSGKHFILHLNGDKLCLENLSTAGVRMGDKQVFDSVDLKPGMSFYAGNSLKCMVEDDALTAKNDNIYRSLPAVTEADHETQDSAAVGGAVPETTHDSADSARYGNDSSNFSTHGTGTGTASAADDSAHTGTNDSASDTHGAAGTQGDNNSSGNISGSSVGNKTRLASPAEIEFIKQQKKDKLVRLFVFRIVAIVLLVLLAMGIWFFSGSSSEEKLTWAMAENGGYSTDMAALEGKSFKDGGFSIYYPKYASTVVNANDKNVVVKTALGKKGEVPLFLVLNAIQDPKSLSRTLEEELDLRCEQFKSKIEEHWNFEAKSPLHFLGDENGVPSMTVEYGRKKSDATLFGIMRIFRQADTTYLLRLEVPMAQRERAAQILQSSAFVVLSSNFIFRHWEGNPDGVDSDIVFLHLLKSKIRQACPARLPYFERKIRGALIASTLSGDKEKLALAEELLGLLRLEQRQCFNALRIKRINARIEGNQGALAMIQCESLAIFDFPMDRRCKLIREKRW